MNENAICQILGAQLVQRYEKAHFVMLNKPSKHIKRSKNSSAYCLGYLFKGLLAIYVNLWSFCSGT